VKASSPSRTKVGTTMIERLTASSGNGLAKYTTSTGVSTHEHDIILLVLWRHTTSPLQPAIALVLRPEFSNTNPRYAYIYTNGLHNHTRISYVAVRQVHKSQQINGDIISFPGRSLHLGWIDGISCPMVETKPSGRDRQVREGTSDSFQMFQS